MTINPVTITIACLLSAGLSGCTEGGDGQLRIDVGTPSESSGETLDDSDVDTDGSSTGSEAESVGETGETSSSGDAPAEPGSEGESGSSTSEGLPPGSEGGETSVPDDGDSMVDPALTLQFRNTAPGPISVDAPLFNEEPIDAKGVQYSGTIAADDDPSDHIQFSVVPGETDPYVRVTLDCDDPQVRAEIRREGALIDLVLCQAEEESILLPQTSSFDRFDVAIHGIDDALAATDYVLSINGFCFQGCDYQPYAP